MSLLQPRVDHEAQNSQISIQDYQRCRDCGLQLCLESKHYCQESLDYQPKRCYCQRESIKMSIHLHPFAFFDAPKWVFEWSLPKLNKSDESLRSFRWRFFCSFSPSWKQPSPFGESNAGWAHELGKKPLQATQFKNCSDKTQWINIGYKI